MNLFKKVSLFATIAAILLTQGCATATMVAKNTISKAPPREAYVMLRKEVSYEICYNYHDMFDEAMKGEESRKVIEMLEMKKENIEEVQCWQWEDSKTIASGVHIEKFQSPKDGSSRSLLLTAGHFCEEPDYEVKNDIIHPEFKWKMPKLEPFIESEQLKWKFIANTYIGLEVAVTELIATDMDNDICLLESERIGFEPVKLAPRGLMYGDKIANISTPYGLFFPPNILIDEGYYIGPTETGSIMMSDMSIGPGSSGSMILVNRLGSWELVGMIHSVIFIKRGPVGNRHMNIGEPMITLGASLGQLKAFIEDNFRSRYLKKD